MATSLSLENDSSFAQGYIKVNGTTAATLTTSGITGNLTGNVTGSLTQGGSLTLATAQTASGTAVDFTGIPSWVKRIIVMFDGVSTNGSSNPIIQIGSGGVTSSGYLSYGGFAGTSGYQVTATTGFVLPMGNGPSNTAWGRATIELVGSNTYIGSVVFGMVQVGAYFGTSGGSVTLSGALDRLRITTVNGTDTFDAGTINICYEG